MGFVCANPVTAARFYSTMPTTVTFHHILSRWFGAQGEPGMCLGTVPASGPVTWLGQNIITVLLEM